ncbi:MAG: hypothetical protein ABSC08_15735 [Bryobacteraceae bacterium]|jgi:hypothetical protein
MRLLFVGLVAMLGAAIALTLLHKFSRFFSGSDDIEAVLIWFAIIACLMVMAMEGFWRRDADLTATPDYPDVARLMAEAQRSAEGELLDLTAERVGETERFNAERVEEVERLSAASKSDAGQ